MIYQNILIGIASVIAVAVIIYLFMAIYKFLTQSSGVFNPRKQIKATPFDIKLYFEEVSFKSSDGINLSGWFVPVRNSRGVILVFHGKGENISDGLTLIDYMKRKIGLNVFIIDYRGYGKSEGRPTENGTYLDARAAWEYLTGPKKIKPQDIIIFGRSLGGAIAARLAKEVKPRALILDSTFTTIKDLAAQIYPYLPVRKFFRFNYPTIEYLKEINSPVLIIHSSEDDYIPFTHAIRLYNAAKEPRQFLKIAGKHSKNYIKSEKIYIEGIKYFISGY
ncbi:MAG TPA: alpha/beta hydrolase [Candidatus Humimicrobiaceae bacterium]|nr:alpha/beta hydrolase [Candidatus Humimicrobiaceae bacterium]